MDVALGSYNVTVAYNDDKSMTFPMFFNNTVGYQMVFSQLDEDSLELNAVRRTEHLQWQLFWFLDIKIDTILNFEFA